MKKIILTALLCCLATGASAQWTPEPDGIGLYFDLDATAVEYMTSTPFEEVSVYLLALYITDPAGISGWECSVEIYGFPTAPIWTLSAGLNVADSAAGLFNVGIGVVPDALPSAEIILLATWTAFIMSPGDIVQMFVLPYPGSVSFPTTPGYASGADAEVLIPMTIANTCANTGSVMINMWCPLPAEECTWSEIKSIYR